MSVVAITESVITEALSHRHTKDLFVSQCKTGSSYGNAQLRILDAWAMTNSWSNWTTFGYEVKISRSDFLKDKKWSDYLPYCHNFYFVCPHGVIGVEELPPEAGLLYVSKTGNKLFVKKHAQRRAIELPIEILIYILMWRTNSVHGERLTESQDKKYWTEWLKKKEFDWFFGQKVSKKIREEIKEKVTKAEEHNKHLISELETLKEIKRLSLEMGIDIRRGRWGLREAIDEMKYEKIHGLKKDVGWKLGNLKSSIENLEQALGV